jgi:hypothetical protein
VIIIMLIITFNLQQIKHALLIVVSVHSSSSMKDITRTIGVHHIYFLTTISRCKVMDEWFFTLDKNLVYKKK